MSNYPCYVLTMCFYDKTPYKEQITFAQLKYYQYIKNIFKENNIVLNFVLVGSEKEKSKQIVLNAGFREDEYYEWSQPNDMPIVNIIENKHMYAYEKAFNDYPNLQMLISNGSSDFIPIEFFYNLIKEDIVNHTEPILYGIQNFGEYGDKGYVIEVENTLNNMHILKKVPNQLRKTNFLGGIYALNKQLLININYKMYLPEGNEYELEKYLVTTGKANTKSLTDFFLNYKVYNCDYTSIETILKIYRPEKYFGDNSKVEQIVNFIKGILHN